ncbi:MAG TPA: hypothetical protein VKR83_17200, partial [Ktedonobacteraceae bacterium]|nr:hypothetical protein [Ktedonobacteraceae bacterium]
MSGYVGNDGSALAGGLNSSNQVQGLSIDNTGKLNVNASVSSGPTNITQVNGVAVGATNGLPVAGNNGGALVVLDVDSSGRLIIAPDQLVQIASGANVLAVDASGRLTLVPNSSINTA